MKEDVYKTIELPYEGEIYKDRGSKFIGYAFPISREEDIKEYIKELKKQHHKARHWCYAWKLGVENAKYRVNDDGEPSNSAGQPIYGQILSFDITNVLLVVVRYFGGTKLGVGGLINAYKNAAKLVLESSEIKEKTVDVFFKLVFEYEYLDKVMRIIKERNLTIESQMMEMNCEFVLSVRKKDAEKVKIEFEELRCLQIKYFEN